MKSRANATGPRRSRRLRALVFGVGLGVCLAALPDLIGRVRWGPPRSAQTVFPAHDAMTVVPDGDGLRIRAAAGFLNERVPRARTPGRPRVLFLGESSVHRGAPGSPEDFPTQVARRMPEVDCVNLGAPAAKMRSIADLVAALDVEYDLVVLYTGHNEFADAIFSGATVSLPRWQIQLMALGRKSYLHDLFIAPPSAPVVSPPRVDGTHSLIASGPPFSRAFADDLEDNFRSELARFYAAVRAPVVAATLLRSWDRGPTGLELDAAHPSCGAVARAAQASPPNVQELRAACGENHASTEWARVREARARGDRAAASAAFGRMLEADPLPLRAPPGIDTISREEAAAHGATLVDLAATIGVSPPEGWFADVLHPTPDGAAAIAAALTPAIREVLAR